MALHSCVLTVIVTTPSPFVSTAIVLQSCALVVTTMTLLFAYSVSLTLNPFILFLLPLSLLLVPVNSFVSARFGFLELMLTVIFVERQKVWVSGIGVWEGDKAQVIQTLLFVIDISTLLQALFRTRLPAVVGGLFAYVIPIAHNISSRYANY
ncbi:hypothetical protein GLYMA_20G082100v4 [Glycine max]|nr:hypothetical protein GLYMA_20G082100v4 [Glycine max]KAH1035127.1 hypothetical protein GYH30_055206 [Glycine max]